MLKTTNYFNTIIQNNLKQTQEGREVRIPFFSGKWIKVYENEIDKRYKVKDQQDRIREFSINSDTSL